MTKKQKFLAAETVASVVREAAYEGNGKASKKALRKLAKKTALALAAGFKAIKSV